MNTGRNKTETDEEKRKQREKEKEKEKENENENNKENENENENENGKENRKGRKKKRKVHRGTKKAKEISIFYNNINGFRTKMDSLSEILERLEPNILCLCETKVGSSNVIKNNIERSGYKGITRSTKDGKGGLLIATRINTIAKILDVTSSPLRSILVGRLEIRGGHLRIILGYAPQETESPESRQEFFTELSIEIQKAGKAGDTVLVLGDFNAKMEENKENKPVPTSNNGKLLCEVLEESDLKVINMSKKCIGKWTHVIRTTEESSRLDYVIADNMTERQITKMIIDESTLLCPFYMKTKEKVLSDHNSIIITLRVQAKKKQKGGIDLDNIKWIVRPEGVEKLSEKCDEILKGDLVDGTTQDKYNQFEAKIKKVLSECFKQTTSKKQSKRKKEQESKKYKSIVQTINVFAKKGKAQRKVARIYQEKLKEIQMKDVTRRKAERIKEVVNQMTIDGNFNVHKFWKIRKSNKKKQQDCTSVIKDGREVYDDDQIMTAFRDEFQKRLQKPEREEWLENISQKIDSILEHITQAIGEKSSPFTLEELKKVLKKILSGKASGPDEIPPEIFKYGGETLENILLEMVNEIKESSEIPEQWNYVDISTIYKNKGKMKDLKNQRGIFLTAVAYKLFEKLMVNRMEDVTKRINLLQAGGRKNRSTCDQTFIMRCLINHALYIGKKLYITCYDYKQCFDKLWLQEAVLSMHKLGLSNEYANLILKLNETSKISIKTPFGKTERFEEKFITKQGTVLGPTLCGCSLGECLDVLEGEGGASIGAVTIPALAFVDDMNTMNTNVRDVHTSHDKTVWFSKRKNQPLNEDKCEILCVNSSEGDVVPTLSVNDKMVKSVDEIMYIGDSFNRKGSNNDLVNDRIAKGMRCLRNTVAECGDITLGQYAIETLVLLYKTVFLKTVLVNCEAWCNLTKTNCETLQILQMKYLKRILHAPKSTPNIAIMVELGVKPIITEIHVRQLNFLHHILCLGENDPVKMVYKESKRFLFEKSWYREVKTLLKKYNLEEEESKIKEMSKEEWKSLIDKKVCAETVEQYNTACKNGKMTSSFHPITRLETKEYMKKMVPSKARILFKVRCKTIDLRGHRQYKYEDTTCRLCNEGFEDINHVLNECSHVEHKTEPFAENDIYGSDLNKLITVVMKIQDFYFLVKEKDTEYLT